MIMYRLPGVLFLMTTTKSDSVGAASILTLRLNVSPSMTEGFCPEIDITDTALAEKRERWVTDKLNSLHIYM